jgi:hypothetical protein
MRSQGKTSRASSVGDGVATVVGQRDGGVPVVWGLAGLSEERLNRAGRSIADGFDACRNLQAAAALLHHALQSAEAAGLSAEKAERRALRSIFLPEAWPGWSANGYAARVLDERTRLLPRLTSLTVTVNPLAQQTAQQRAATPSGAQPSTLPRRPSVTSTGWQASVRPEWIAFGTAPAASVLVFNRKTGE